MLYLGELRFEKKLYLIVNQLIKSQCRKTVGFFPNFRQFLLLYHRNYKSRPTEKRKRMDASSSVMYYLLSKEC